MTAKPTDNDNHANGGSTLSIDWDLYGEYLADSDLSDDQKLEFIETLWNIVVAFVDLGFGVHPIQQVSEQLDAGEIVKRCEQKDESRIILPDDLLNSLKDTPNTQATAKEKS